MRRAELTPNTRLAQAATEYAKSFGKAEAFHRAAYRALWEDGANLGDLSVLEKLASGVGLDAGDLIPRLESGQYDAPLEQQHDEALRIGVTGVPAFVVDGRFWFTGAQPIALFRLAAKRALDARQDRGEAG